MDPLKELKVPVSLFVGSHDTLSTPTDDRKIMDKLASGTVYREVEADHLSLLIGKDMSYFQDEVMGNLF